MTRRGLIGRPNQAAAVSAMARPAADRRLIGIGTLATVATSLVAVVVIGLFFVPIRAGVASPSLLISQNLITGGFGLVTVALALVILRAQPRSPIGWLFVALPLFLLIGSAGDALARRLPPSSAVEWATVVTNFIGQAAGAPLILLVLLFPTGQLIARSWLWVYPVLIVGVLSTQISWELQPALVYGLTDLRNPIGRPEWSSALGVLNAVGGAALMTSLVAAIAHLGARFRRARGVERQQLKWFALAGSVVVVALLVAGGTSLAGYEAEAAPLWLAAFGTLLLLPISATLAILRYRLYDIDRIISRTLAYAVLTAILAGVYLAGFLGIQSVLAPFTANGGPVAVAASTLVVFALFQPVRRWIQGTVDRRFYRSRYDAQREIEGFAARVRDEVEVDRLAGAISATLERTMQPASASIWLRSEGPAGAGEGRG
jgi:hypothetical protein